MTREELVKLVREIMNVKGKTEEELSNLIDLLSKNVPHPAVSNLIYWEDLTPEQIVDKALNYKPIVL
jgi:hypothetical protein